MGFYREQILPRMVDWLMDNREHARLRRRVTGGLEGRVLELGFGSGLNLPHYPAAVEKIYAVDPAVVGRRIGAARIQACPIPIEFVGLDGENLPVEDRCVDVVLSTWTLCTIANLDRALGEVRRVLKPGGRLHFIEHGLSPDPAVARWQHRLNPLQKRFGGGCCLNRQIEHLVRDGGFAVERVEKFYMRGPRIFTYTFEGWATPR